MYGIQKILIRKGDALYQYCCDTTESANDLYNATLFRIRQVLTGVYKETPTENEQSVLDEIRNALPAMGGDYVMPHREATFLSYRFLEKLFRVTNNSDFFDKRLSKQCAQNVVRLVVQNMKAYYAAVKTYAANPQAFTGKPKLPNYHRPGGRTTVNITNQDCVVYGNEIKLPLTKSRCRIGRANGRLKQASIVPYHDVFFLHFVFDDEIDNPVPTENPSRCCAIDLGTDNLAAVTNNIGLPGLLFKGGIIKSENQYYNKQMAKLQAEQAARTGKDFVPTHRSNALFLKRNNTINDVIHKTAKAITNWCIAHQIDTLIVGSNKLWKQECGMGKVSNQTFVQIPFDRFKWMLQYRAERAGIRYIEQEESYTSKASFLNCDPMPVYGQEGEAPQFSGHRIHRGLYKTADTTVNADLNGSANIGRKAFPELFVPENTDVRNALVIRSHRTNKCNPFGIVAREQAVVS